MIRSIGQAGVSPTVCSERSQALLLQSAELELWVGSDLQRQP